jgi:zinc protease
MVVTLNAPEKTGEKIPSAEEVNQIINAVEVAKLEPHRDKQLATSLMDDSKLKPGKIVSSKADDDLGTTVIKLSNGATVILKQTNFKNDEIMFRAFSKGGHSLVKDADYYSGNYAAAIVAQSGVGNFSAIDLSNMLKGKNTSVSPGIATYSEALSGSTIPKETETLFQLIYLYFTSPRKDKGAFESFQTRQKQFVANLAADPSIYFSAEFQKLMTRNHPRAGGLPKPEDFDKINLDRSIQIYKGRFANAGDFTFLFVGSFEEEKIRPLLEKYIGSLPASSKKETFKDLGIRPPAGRIDTVITRGSDPKSMVSIVFTSPVKYDSKDDYALRSLSDVMDIKLVEQLREEKGSVYGVGATGGMSRIPYESYSFTITFPCAPDNADTLTRAALDELKKIVQSGVEMKQNAFWMNSLFNIYYYGNKPTDFLNSQKQIDQLTSKMLQDVARKYINLNQYIRATLKPEVIQKKPF